MKYQQAIKWIANFICFWLLSLASGQSFVSLSDKDIPIPDVEATKLEFLTQPELLMSHWKTEPIPLRYYTPSMVEQQKCINELATESIVTWSPEGGKTEWTRIDQEEITPHTWKWVDFKMTKGDGSVSNINLRRPVWWIKQNQAEHVGNTVFLDMPELGLAGLATIISIRPNQLDTRFWDEKRTGNYIQRPITGKLQHVSKEVYKLRLDNELLQVTGSHPFWSMDRRGWVNAADLEPNERIKTLDGDVRVLELEKKEGWDTVYNIEVYRDHHYLVGESKVLVHNSCIGHRSVADIVKSKNIRPYPGQITVDREFVEKTVKVMEGMLAKNGKIDWVEITRKASDGPIKAFRYKDGTIRIINGRHRVLAAELVRKDIPWDNPAVVDMHDLPYTFKKKPHDNGWEDVEWGTEKEFTVIRTGDK